ncbi:hypothetical protein [Roseomonas chloroacetimidivorans]
MAPDKKQDGAGRGDLHRRVYVLPEALIDGIRAYMADVHLTNETEAVRRLLWNALQQRDTVETLEARIAALPRRNARKEALEMLALHPKVSTIRIEDTFVAFTLADGSQGRFPPVKPAPAPGVAEEDHGRG